MDKEKQYKIALAIKNDGLEYDDRVRKEILSIKKLYPNIEFKIFVMLPDNREYEGVTSYGVPFKAIYMPSRQKYPSAKKILKKTYEFYSVIKKDLQEFDAVWCGDYHSVAIALFCRNKPVLWDLHELPSMLLGNWLKHYVLCKVFKNCRVVVHANPQRIDYLNSLGCIKDPDKHIALRNYPNFEDIDKEYDDKYYAFRDWKGNRKCVYLQGLSASSRADRESIEAVLAIPDLVAVVVGDINNETKEKLKDKFGTAVISKRVYYIGRIPQLKIPQYMELCYMSLIFYKNVSPNNLYCEANRFYQSVIVGLPVVVGNNPSMKELIDKYDFGVSIDDDGQDVEKIIKGINKVMSNYDYYLRNVKSDYGHLLWNSQENEFRNIIDRLLA